MDCYTTVKQIARSLRNMLKFEFFVEPDTAAVIRKSWQNMGYLKVREDTGTVASTATVREFGT